MQNRTPCAPNAGEPIPSFTPVPRRNARHDGWTPERQRAFIEALADTASVSAAARRINMAPEGAYQLRRAAGAEEFRAAWDAALDFGIQTLTDLAIDRVKHGTPEPIFWKGEQVGERRRYNERLHMFILKHHQPHVYQPPQLKTGTKALDTLKREWEDEYDEQARDSSKRAVAAFFRHMDSVRGHLLKDAHASPELRAAWELIVGPIDWDKVGAWEQGQPTQFQYENITDASTHLALLQYVERGSNVTVADLIFGPLIDPEDGTMNTMDQ